MLIDEKIGTLLCVTVGTVRVDSARRHALKTFGGKSVLGFIIGAMVSRQHPFVIVIVAFLMENLHSLC